MNLSPKYSNYIFGRPEPEIIEEPLYDCAWCDDSYERNSVMRITDLSDNVSLIVCKHCASAVINESLDVQRANEVNPGVMIDNKFI